MLYRTWCSRWTGVLLTLTLATGLLVAWGCVGSLKESGGERQTSQLESNTAATTADVVTAAKTSPPDVEIVTTSKDGTTVKVTQPVQTQETTSAATQTDEDRNLDMASKSSWYSSIPLGVKLILLAIGLGGLLIIGGLLLRHSKALNGAWKWADESMAGRIHRMRSKAAAPGTSEELRSFLLEEVANEERERTNFHKEP